MPTLPPGYEIIDGHKYTTRELQATAYEDIQLHGFIGEPGAYLFGRPRTKPEPMPEKLAWPLDKVYITQLFGKNPDVYKRFGLRGHNGIDLRTRYLDSPLAHRNVMASAPGWCEVRLDGSSGYGNHVRVHHLNGAMTIYGHLWKVKVYQKGLVRTGDVLGLSGNSGFSSGPHLHFELRLPGWETHNNDGWGGACDPIPHMLPVPKA